MHVLPEVRLVAAMVLALVGCGGAAGGAGGPVAAGEVETGAAGNEITPDVRLRIVDASFGAEHSKRAEPMVVPFGVNQNGTELVYVLLERASRAGAAFVGDLTVLMTFRWRGEVVECRTPVLFDGDRRLDRAAPAVTATPASAYSTDIDVFKPQPIETMVNDRELVCAPRSVAVKKRRRVHNTARGAEHARSYDADSSEIETVQELERRLVCAFETITRRTTRFDYELKLGFVPPDWRTSPRLTPTASSSRGGSRAANGSRGGARQQQPAYRLTATGTTAARSSRRAGAHAVARHGQAQWTPAGMNEDTCNNGLPPRRRRSPVTANRASRALHAVEQMRTGGRSRRASSTRPKPSRRLSGTSARGCCRRGCRAAGTRGHAAWRFRRARNLRASLPSYEWR